MFGVRGVAVGAVVAFTKGFCKAAKYSFSFFLLLLLWKRRREFDSPSFFLWYNICN